MKRILLPEFEKEPSPFCGRAEDTEEHIEDTCFSGADFSRLDCEKNEFASVKFLNCRFFQHRV